MILVIVLYLLAGIVNSVMDTLRDKFSGSIFSEWGSYWNPAESWKNKWKNGDPAQGERFPLSSTALVFLTDAWHLGKWLMFTLIEIAICVSLCLPWYLIPVGVLILKTVRGIGFNPFYDYFLKKKK